MRGTKWKKMILSTAFLLSTLLLQACSTQTQSSKPAVPSSAKGKDGGTLTVVRLSDATKLDPHFITDIPSANIVYQKVYETLVVPDENMKPHPKLATKWTQLNETTWEFELRQGVAFQDGTPFDAEAVQTTFKRLLDPQTRSPQASKLAMIKDIAVVDRYTVQFHLNEPYTPLLSILASNEGSIISPKVLKENPKQLMDHPVGTGPFMFEHWKTGQEIALKKNGNYWGAKPAIDRVVFKVVPEDTTRLAMVEAGEAHINDQVPVSEIDRIEASKALSLYRTEGLGVEFIGFNTQKAPLDNVKVRKAISHAIQRDGMMKGVYNNSGRLANAAMSPKVFGYSEEIKPLGYNLNQAKQLLKEAGFTSGLELTIVTNDRKERIALAEVVQSQLKGIGVNAKVQVLEWGAYIDTLNNGKHQMYIGGWGNATGDGDYNQYNLFHSSSHGGAGNHMYYKNEKVDTLIEAARKEMTEGKRKSLYQEAMKIELEEAVYIPIRYYEHLAVHNKHVEGIWINPVNYLMLDEVTLK
ncbi:glutathione ABC transporter substrate-binding protein [Ectobacillus sp. JY-23]|uniref:glutathione ABC transporter substrate-binding protein n=1 Tax=Ectobacillus sp. JY-23 TaxID=2933872 RepID=UPI001FF5B6C8|nr:glutathione ABC transporter substrate-binding protein [Ectobacillus sp. JY-23]UOY93309.1 glutathione ABC transporter substrate-binding protein [Ectobacillus sp. JY-23]